MGTKRPSILITRDNDPFTKLWDYPRPTLGSGRRIDIELFSIEKTNLPYHIIPKTTSSRVYKPNIISGSVEVYTNIYGDNGDLTFMCVHMVALASFKGPAKI